MAGGARYPDPAGAAVSEPAAPPLRFDDQGLIPVTVQDAVSGDVLMVAFMNAEALAATRRTGLAHFWSRSRGRLWRKGETSGNTQAVEDIFVNCERTSLLLRVRQTGAVCHDGYPTCYYRRLEPDGGLSVVVDRSFDPALVYGDQSAAPLPDGPALAAATRLLYGAYAHLRDHDLAAVSGTASRLRAERPEIERRLADELEELAGVLDGSHAHADPQADVVLEGSQVVYWTTLVAVRDRVTWAALRMDRALATGEAGMDPRMVARILRAEAERWRLGPGDEETAPRCHATLALVGQACLTAGVDPLDVVRHDLRSLRERPYLADYFRAAEGPSD